MRRLSACLLLLIGLAGCESKQVPVRHEPIVVYASYADESYLPGLFTEFTEQTGIPVTVAYDRSEVHARNLIFNIGSPPVDVFLSRDVAHLWNTADEGALRPISAPNLANVPEDLRDQDGLWTALGYQQSVVIHGRDVREPHPAGLVDFAKDSYSGRLCVSSSSLPASRLVLAMMIADLGAKQTERVVRNWMKNLATAPFRSEADLLAAVEAGDCEFGVVSGWQMDPDLSVIRPVPDYVQIEGVGIARHSRYPDSAQHLVNWMLSEPVNQRHARALGASPVIGQSFDAEAGQPPAVAGWNDEDARLLAERASYR